MHPPCKRPKASSKLPRIWTGRRTTQPLWVVAPSVSMMSETFSGLGSELEVRIDRLDARMDRFDDRLRDLRSAIRQQTRHFILASTGTMVVLTGVAFGAAALV